MPYPAAAKQTSLVQDPVCGMEIAPDMPMQHAGLATSGYQEAMIPVKSGYTPDVIVVQHRRPVRLSFRHEETAACSEMVVFGDFGKSAKLPEGEVVPVEFLPEKPGEYEFTCQMGMLRGKLIVG